MRSRVLFLTSNFPRWGGDSTTPFVLHLASDLRELGWDVHVLAPHAPGAARQEVLAGVPVRRFRYLAPERAQTVCYGGGALVNVRRSSSTMAKVPALVAAEWAATLRHAKSSDLVHAHWLVPQGAVAASSCPLIRRPWIATVHGGDVFALRHPAIERVKRGVLRRAHAVTVNSSVTAGAVARIAPGVEPVTIPMGVAITTPPAADVAAARRAYLSDGRRLVVFVGRLVEEKGVFDVVTAAGILRDTLPDVSVLIVGDGQDRSELERVVRDDGLGSTVRFAGWQDPDSVRAIYAVADVVLVPSRTGPDGWVEAQGLSVVEAMSAGCPVVATAHGGIVDSVRDEETGLLVPEADPPALALAIRRLLTEASLAHRVAAEAQRFANTRFDRRRVAARFSELYERVLAVNGSA
jgi:phosphatidylinositol alpha-1,6-mannosyltransferase